MKSRMERYYTDTKPENETIGRASRNQELYKKRDYDIYSSNETIIDTTNEIDISKIKDIIKSREDYQRAKSYRNMLSDKKFDTDEVDYQEDVTEEKDYDINTLLQKVKEQKGSNDDEKEKVRKLKNTQYDILSKLDVKSKEKNTMADISDEQLKDLINTITHRDNQEDDLMDLLSDLRSGDTTTIVKSAKELENELTKENIKEKATILNTKIESENDFYSDSFTFSKKDFEGFTELEESINSNNNLIKVLIFILIVVILTIGLFVADSFFDFIPFI